MKLVRSRWFGGQASPVALIMGAALLALVAMQGQAGAFTAKQILTPLDNQEAILQNALKFNTKIYHEQRSYLEAERKYFVRCLNQGLGWSEARLRADLRRREAVNGAMKAACEQLRMGSNNAYVPKIGTMNIKTCQQRYQAERKSIQAIQAKIAAGEHSLWVDGIGATTGKFLNQRITDKQQQAKKLNDAYNRGDYAAAYPGLGNIRRRDIKARLKQIQDKKAEVIAQINRGEYSVILPGLGTVTRKQLQARIAEVDRKVAEVKRQFQKKEARIVRPFLGSVDQKSMEARLDQNKQQTKKLNDKLASMTYRAALPTLGTVDQRNLRTRKKDAEDQRKQFLDKWKAGDYPGPVEGHGLMTRKQINQRKAAKKISGKENSQLTAGLTRLNRARELEDKMRHARVLELADFDSNFQSAAIPQKHKLQMEHDYWSQVTRSEFNHDRSVQLQQLEAQRAFLEQSLALIPAKAP